MMMQLLTPKMSRQEHRERVNKRQEGRTARTALRQIHAHRRLDRALAEYLRADGDPKDVLQLVPGISSQANTHAVSSTTQSCCAS